jgi:EmrB/QacA subfamily drug resistance transporter
MPAVPTANHKWLTLAAMTGAQAMLMVDATIVGLALPDIQRDLDISTTALQWIVGGYMLAMAALLAIGGWLSDRVGAIWIFRLGVVVFVAGLACSGLSRSLSSIDVLLAARVVQGIGAALMVPTAQAIVTDTFPKNQRGGAMGIWGTASMLAMVAAPAYGGFVTQHFGWEWLFWTLIPIGLSTLAITAIVAPGARTPSSPGRFDAAGAALLVVGLGATVFGFMQSSSWGWGDPRTLAPLAVGVLALGGMVGVELRKTAPIVDLRLFGHGAFGLAALVFFVIGAPATVTSVFGARYLQDVLEFSPSQAGLALMPLSAAMLLLAIPGGRFYDKVGPRVPISLGLGALALAMMLGAWAIREHSYPLLVPSLVLIGVGLSLASTPANTEAMNAAPADLRGEAAGLVQTVGQAGNVLILALLTSIVVTIENQKVDRYLTSAGIRDLDAKQAEGILAEARGGDPSRITSLTGAALDELIRAVQDAYTAGVEFAYALVAGVMAGLCVLMALRLRGNASEPTVQPVDVRATPPVGSAEARPEGL